MQNGTNKEQKERSAEIDQAFLLCCDIIDSPPPDYKLVRQAVLGLAHLASQRDDLRPIVVMKFLQVIGEPIAYRSHPRRYAVTSLAYLSYFDEKLVEPAIQLFTQLVQRRSESSQYVRKAAFIALSRIGRKYPKIQPSLLPIFLEQYADPRAKPSVIFGIVTGIGRMAQSNALLRTQFSAEFIKCCSHESWTVRWGGILGLGHAVCPIGNVENDAVLESTCFELCLELMKHGGVPELKDKQELTPEDWKREDYYFVQYAAVQALGLLLRSNPDKWWEKIAPVFADVLVHQKYAARTKAMVLITYGKIAYYMSKDNPYYKALKDLLFELSKHENILVAEPAVYGLCNFALAHEEIYEDVKNVLIEKLNLKNVSLDKADPMMLSYYLKTWCKLLSRSYHPVLNLCSNVISSHSQEKISATMFQTAMFDDITAQQVKEQEAIAKSRASVSALQEQQQAARLAAQDAMKFFDLCSGFSASVVESVLLLLTDATLFDDAEFLSNLKSLVIHYKNNQGKKTIDQKGLIDHFKQLFELDIALRECAALILTTPEVLDNTVWMTNTRILVTTAMQMKAVSASPSMDPAIQSSAQPSLPLVQPPMPIAPTTTQPVLPLVQPSVQPPMPVAQPSAPDNAIMEHLQQIIQLVQQNPAQALAIPEVRDLFEKLGVLPQAASFQAPATVPPANALETQLAQLLALQLAGALPAAPMAQPATQDLLQQLLGLLQQPAAPSAPAYPQPQYGRGRGGYGRPRPDYNDYPPPKRVKYGEPPGPAPYNGGPPYPRGGARGRGGYGRGRGGYGRPM